MVGPKRMPGANGAWQVAENIEDGEVIIIDGGPVSREILTGRSEINAGATHKTVKADELFRDYVRILEDGSHVPCGVMEER